MGSFDQTDEAWDAAAGRLSESLADLERRRASFGQVENRLHAVTGRLAEGELLAPLGAAARPGLGGVPFQPMQALSFRLRNHVDEEFTCHVATLECVLRQYDQVRITPAQLLAWHGSAMGSQVDYGGKYKTEENLLPDRRADGVHYSDMKTAPAADADRTLATLCERLNATWERRPPRRMICAAAFVIDFFCVHPFTDGNGRMGRLSFLAMALQMGHRALLYGSLESAFSRRRNEYLAALNASRIDWRGSRHDLVPWTAFLIALVADVYDDVEARTAELEQLADQLDACRAAIDRRGGPLRRAQLLAAEPGLSPVLLDWTLARLVRAGKLAWRRDGAESAWEWTNRAD